MKGSGEDEIGITFLKNDFCDPFSPAFAGDHSQIIILYASYIIQVYLALNFSQNALRFF